MKTQFREIAGRVGRFTQGAKNAASSILTGSVMVGGAPLSEHLALIGKAAIAAAAGEEGGSTSSEGIKSEEESGRLENQNQLERRLSSQHQVNGGEISTNTHLSINEIKINNSKDGVESLNGENIPNSRVGDPNNNSKEDLSSSPPRPMSPTSASLAAWELIERSSSWDEATLPSWARPRPPPLTLDELLSMEDSEGRMIPSQMEVLRERAFTSGIDPGARPEAWKFLLGLHSPGETRAERAAGVDQRLKQYLVLKRQWQSIGEKQAGRFSKWKERKSMVDKDVRRTGEKLLCD